MRAPSGRLAPGGVLLLLPALASARPVEPFHMQPIAPATAVMLEGRPTVFDQDLGRDNEMRFGIGWLAEGRLALPERDLDFAVTVPFGVAFVENRDTLGLGNVEVGAGIVDGTDWMRAGVRVTLPTASEDPAPRWVGMAGRPYDLEHNQIANTSVEIYGAHAGEKGRAVGQVEAGFGAFAAEDRDTEYSVRLGVLGGVRVSPRAVLLTELTFRDMQSAASWNGQLSVQPGIRYVLGRLDLGCYLMVPVDRPLGGGDAFALGMQALWNIE